MKPQPKKIKCLLNKISNAFKSGWKSFEASGRFIIELEKEVGHAHCVKLVLEQDPRMTDHVQSILRDVAERKTHPALLGDANPIAKRILAIKAPMEIQKDYFKKFVVEVVVGVNEDGSKVTEKKEIPKLSLHEFGTVYDKKEKNWCPVEKQAELVSSRKEHNQFKKIHAEDWEYNATKTAIKFNNRHREWNYGHLMELAEKVKPHARELESTLKKNQISGGLNPELSKIR